MSKQSEAKEQQGYVAKPAHATCSNCEHFKCDMVTVPATQWFPAYTEEKKVRCGLGGFKVAKMGTCLLHRTKQVTA